MSWCDHWRPIAIVCLIFIISLPAAVRSSTLEKIIQEQVDQAAKRIMVVSNARLRMSPQTTADEVTRLPLGTIVLTLDQSAEKEKIGGMEDFWYRVRTEDGKSGWLFGGLTASFFPSSREEIYLRIAAERLKTARQDFFEQVDLYKFLTRAIAEIKTPTIAAELELSQLLALSNSLRAIPRPREPQQPYASWLQIYEADTVYSEPGAMWLVKLERFWELEKKYHGLPIGERTAWTAAQYELPGECEGDIPCLFGVMRMREGTYLELYPNGAHAGEIISRINELLRFISHDTQFLQNQMHSELSSEDRSQLKNAIGEFRKVIMKIANSKKNALLKQIDQLSQAIP
jgi:SH3 domain-containing protein